MSDEERAREDEVFGQKLEVGELDAASGGLFAPPVDACGDARTANCVDNATRPIYGPDGNQFPYCAATVEKGSCCYGNDGCLYAAVVYKGQRTDCGRAWE